MTDTATHEATIADAREELREAQALVAALADRVRNGDDSVQAHEIGAAEDLAKYAALRLESATRRVNEARTAQRLDELASIRTEIEEYEYGAGEHLADLAQTVLNSLATLTNAITDRNAQIQTWRRQMTSHRVPRHVNPVAPAEEHGQLGWDDELRVITPTRRMGAVNTTQVLQRILDAYQRAGGADVGIAWSGHVDETHNVITYLAAFDAAPTEPPSTTRYFQMTGGMVIGYDREPTEHERRGIDREISRDEALGR